MTTMKQNLALSLMAAICFIGLSIAPSRAAPPNLTYMRAVHMEGNWGGNVAGIKTAIDIARSPIDQAASITVASTQTIVSRNSFTNSQGVTETNDLAQVTLTGVVVGGTDSYTQAGFWIGRTVGSGAIFLQFRPSFDPALKKIAGFAADISIPLGNDGKSIDVSSLSNASGPALTYVYAVLAQAGSLVSSGSFSLQSGATFDKATIVSLLNGIPGLMRAKALAQQDTYFQWLRDQNVDWIGISVAMVYGPIADPTVKLYYRPTTGASSSEIYTFDDTDLENFIVHARKLGFKIYLTLAFEPSALPISKTDPTCNTDKFKVNRYLLGYASFDANDSNGTCINASLWWWNPTHPNYAANVATFWSGYKTIAVKYGAFAQRLGVEMFSLGTETEALFRTRLPTDGTNRNQFKSYLVDMVSAVRAVYSGLLTYDQGYNGITSAQYLGTASLFADLGLDVVGISAYFQLATTKPTSVMTLAQLESAWDNIFRTYLVPVQTANPGKPVIFLEFGYTDSVGAPFSAQSEEQTPTTAYTGANATDGMKQQQNIIQAFFNTDDRYNNLVRGAFIWGNGNFANAPWNCTTVYFNQYCKPSASTVRDVYARWTGLADTSLKPQAGWWWNPSEPGRGYGIERSATSGDLFFGAYMYDTAGSPVWYVASLSAGPSNSYSGTLSYYTGGQTLSGSYKAPTGSQSLGTVKLTMSSESAASLAISGGSLNPTQIQIERYNIVTNGVASLAPTYQPQTGWWWNAAESGRGYFIESQASTVFLAAYMYDSTQKPVWYAAQNALISNSIFAGTLSQYSGGQTLGGAFKPASISATPGTVSLQFTSPFAGTLILPNGTKVSITRYAF